MTPSLAALPDDSPILSYIRQLNGGREEQMLVSIPQATHGDRDVSQYRGYEVLIAGRAKAEDGSLIRPLFSAMLRRVSDGALRLVCNGSTPLGLVERDSLLPSDRSEDGVEIFSGHEDDIVERAEAVISQSKAIQATEADMREYDNATATHIASLIRQSSGMLMDPDRATALRLAVAGITPLRRDYADKG